MSVWPFSLRYREAMLQALALVVLVAAVGIGAMVLLIRNQPEKRAFLWLAVNAGAVQEDDDQRGLAPFDEHMAFNGTKRFPKQEIVDYLGR